MFTPTEGSKCTQIYQQVLFAHPISTDTDKSQNNCLQIQKNNHNNLVHRHNLVDICFTCKTPPFLLNDPITIDKFSSVTFNPPQYNSSHSNKSLQLTLVGISQCMSCLITNVSFLLKQLNGHSCVSSKLVMLPMGTWSRNKFLSKKFQYIF